MSQDLSAAPPSVLDLRLRQQDLVAEFGRFAIRADDLTSIFDQACVVAADGLGVRFAKLLEKQPGERDFLVRAGVGWDPGVIGIARVGADLASPAGYAFQTGQPIISNHLAVEQRFRTPRLLQEHGIRSALNVLVHERGDEPYGVLEGDSKHRSDFTQHDLAFLQALANTLAVAIAQQKRQDALQDALEDNKALLAEKDLLMQEVHHRVKNSLSIVRGILSMQADGTDSEPVRAALEAAASRVMAIAAVHHRLYAGGSVRGSDAAHYLKGVIADMRGMLSDGAGDREIRLDIPSFQLAADDMAPLGLITVELVTNAMKHGHGEIRVHVRPEAETLEVVVEDAGPGFPPGFDADTGTGLGMRLVMALANNPEGAAVQVDRNAAYSRILVRMRLR